MIYSAKQYEITTEQLAKFRKALAFTKKRNTGEEWLRRLEIDALQSQIDELESELAEYDLLKSGQFTLPKSLSLNTLPSTLVKARIASGLSQAEFAGKVGITLKQMQLREAEDYADTSSTELIEIASLLNIQIDGGLVN